MLEADIRALDVGAGELGGLQALHFLLARVDLAERVPAEKRAMKSLSCAIFFSRCSFCDSMRDGSGSSAHHVVVAAGVDDDGLVVDVRDVGADRVEEVAVVRDGDDRAVVTSEEVLQPVDGFEIEVVGRLVEQQCLGIAEERLCQQHANLLAALQLGHLALVDLVGDVEALEQDGGVGLGLRSRLLRRRCLRARPGVSRPRRSSPTCCR